MAYCYDLGCEVKYEDGNSNLIRVRKHDLPNKNTKTKTMRMTKNFRKHLQRAIFDTFHLWVICSE